MLSFDRATGLLVAEPGVTFGALFDTFLPRASCRRSRRVPVLPPSAAVSPTTCTARTTTSRAASATTSNGSICCLPSGESRRLTRADPEPALPGDPRRPGADRADRARLRCASCECLRNALLVRKRRIRDLDEFLAAFKARSQADLRGRLDRRAGPRAAPRPRHSGDGGAGRAEPGPRRREIPPRAVRLSRRSLSAARPFARSMRVYRRHVPRRRRRGRRWPYAKFLFPLDALHDWNRIYGRRGFHQFQCLVPFEGGATALRRLLELHRAVGPRLLPGGAEVDGRARGRLSVVPRPGLHPGARLPECARQ